MDRYIGLDAHASSYRQASDATMRAEERLLDIFRRVRMTEPLQVPP